MTVTGFVLGVVLPIGVLVVSLVFGPLPIVIRGVIRRHFGPAYVHRWFRPASFGIGIGMALAAVVMAVLDGSQTLYLVLLCLLLLLAVIDWQWRWLPIEWTLGVIALGLVHGVLGGDFSLVLQQMLVPSMTILLIRQILQAVLKRQALGLGDVWLIAGLGAFLPVTTTFLMIGLAALSGLANLLLRRWYSLESQKIAGVSYGTHLCAVFLILLTFTQIN